VFKTIWNVWTTGTNILLIIIPIAWAAHLNKGFKDKNGRIGVFARMLICPSKSSVSNEIITVNFLALIPLEHLAEYGGEQLEFYVGKAFGDLIAISLNK
jgi:Ca2+:H+ antiporter